MGEANNSDKKTKPEVVNSTKTLSTTNKNVDDQIYQEDTYLPKNFGPAPECTTSTNQHC